MTAPVAADRRSRPLLGWPLAVVGWAVAASSPAIFWVTGVPAAAVAVAAAVLVTAGCLAIGLRAGGQIMFLLLPTFFVGTFGLAIGADVMSEQLVFHLAGKAATCQVTAVRKVVSDVVTTGSDGRSTTSYDVSYFHTMVCPRASYTIDRQPPYPVGTKTEVTFDPHGKIKPRFSDQIHGFRRTGLIASGVGGLIILVAPFAAWAVGRCHPKTEPPRVAAPRTPYPSGEPVDTPPRFDPTMDQRAMEAMNDMRTGQKVTGIAKMRRLQAELRRAEETRGKSQWPPQGQ